MSQQLGNLPSATNTLSKVAPAKPMADTDGRVDDLMRVTTPENISFQYEVVGPFRRLYAYIIDLLLVLGVCAGIAFVLWMLFVFALVPLAQYMGVAGILDELAGMSSGLVFIAFFLIVWFYGAFWETYYNGRTIGKMSAGIRVITVDGHAIDGVQATLRNFFRGVDVMPWITMPMLFENNLIPAFWALPTCVFGLVVMAVSPRFQRLGDLVANTVVVNEDKKPVPDLEMFEDDRVARLAELIPESFFVSPSLARAIADYAEHRRRLNYQRASEIASYLARPLLDRFGLAADTDHDLFLCSLYYKVFMHREDDDLDGGHMVPETAAADTTVGVPVP